MASAAWKRPGSPIGKKGPRKANPSYKRRTREPWSSADVKMLKQLAKGKHADRSHERQTSTSRRGYPQQGAARRDFPEAHQSFALQPGAQRRGVRVAKGQARLSMSCSPWGCWLRSAVMNKSIAATGRFSSQHFGYGAKTGAYP